MRFFGIAHLRDRFLRFAYAITGLLGMVIYTACAVIGFLGTITIIYGMFS